MNGNLSLKITAVIFPQTVVIRYLETICIVYIFCRRIRVQVTFQYEIREILQETETSKHTRNTRKQLKWRGAQCLY